MSERPRALRPVDAATLLVLDRSHGDIRVLMGRRSTRHVFMPAAYVFPGGRVDRSDGDVTTASALRVADEQRLVDGMKGRPSARRAKALGIAALRETAEETGLALGHPFRGRTHSLFIRHGLAPSLGELRYVARAITPPGRSRRFDTRFFAVFRDAVSEPDGWTPSGTDELEDVQWIALGDAANLDVPRITAVILGEVRERLRVDPELERDLPVPHHHMRHRTFVREED